jgi:hypothetical protein
VFSGPSPTAAGTVVNPNKAFSVTGIRTGIAGVGGYAAAGALVVNDLNVTGAYSTDVVSFYTIQSFSSATVTDVVINARGPWGLVNLDSVGGTVDLSDVSGANSFAGAQIVVMQGLDTVDTFTGTDGDDMIDGRDGADVMTGGLGNDIFRITDPGHHDAGEVIDGGGGSADAVWFASNSGGSLELQSTVTGVEEVRLVSAHAVYSSTETTAKNVDASDVGNALKIYGNDGANTIVGTGFGDTISANGGDDSITGGNEADTIHGGTGTDAAVYTTAYAGHTVAWDGTTATVTGGTDTGATGDLIDGVGKIQFSDGKTVWLVSKDAGSDYTEIAQLFDGTAANGEAATGDIELVAAGD